MKSYQENDSDMNTMSAGNLIELYPISTLFSPWEGSRQQELLQTPDTALKFIRRKCVIISDVSRERQGEGGREGGILILHGIDNLI